MTSKKQYLQELGIEIWQDKNKGPKVQVAAGYENLSSLSSLAEVKQEVAVCALCALCKTRTKTVFGVGNERARAMFIGEAPGANEDLQGEPFVGMAGMLLNAMLQSIGLERADIYIANILKCRPPNNRDPLPEEVRLCTPYLQRQVALVQPKILIAVGRIAAHFLLNTMESMSRLRGGVYQYGPGPEKIPLLVTYHPAYLLRSPGEKRKAYLDFLMIKKMMNG